MQCTRNNPVARKRLTGLESRGEGTKSKTINPAVPLKFTQRSEHPGFASNFARPAREGGGGAGPGPGEATLSYRFGPEMRFCSD